MKQTPQNIVLTGGVNLNKDARVLQRFQLALSQNAFPVVPGILGKREGYMASRCAIQHTTDTIIFPISWALAPPISSFEFVGAFHIANASTKQLFLAASGLDNDDYAFDKGVLVNVGPGQSDYEPIRFVNYRNWCYAIVPGVEGFYLFAPKYLGPGQPVTQYQWTKVSFAFNPNLVGIQN